MKINRLGIPICLAMLWPIAHAGQTAKPMSASERQRKQTQLEKELSSAYTRWIAEDVAYIITDEERRAFKQLNTDDERENFIEQFWLRRDPTPDTQENEFKEEHYRRIAYANERFASGVPGWKTDRGMIYIKFGPPDEIESHPSGGSYQRPIEEGGGSTSTYPFEKWRYRYLEGIGNDVVIEFVDPTQSGEYHMTMDPSEKDALLYVPGAGLSANEQIGIANKIDRFNRSDGTHLPTGNMPLPASMNEFERLRLYSDLHRPPSIRFKDLEGIATSNIRFNTLPMSVRVDYIKITDSSILTPITIEFERRDLAFQTKEGVARATVNVYGRVTSMARRVVSVFEEPVSIELSADLLQKAAGGSSIYQKSIPLAPGAYRLSVVAKDVVSGNMVSYETALNVPRFDEDKLASSTLILADLIEKVPSRAIGAGQFVIGDVKVRPRVSETFSRDETLGVYAQLYNFSPDQTTHKPNATIKYEIVKNGSSEKVLEYTEDAGTLLGASVQQATVQKLLPLRQLEPGQYTLTVTVTDKRNQQTIAPSAAFTVK